MVNDKRNVMDWLNDMAHDEKWPCYYSDSEVRLLAKDTLELMKEQPEIVRCRDCKHYYTKGFPAGMGSCDATLEVGYDDWFCGDGEKE